MFASRRSNIFLIFLERVPLELKALLRLSDAMLVESELAEAEIVLHYTSRSLHYTSRSVRMVKPVGSPCAAVPQQPIINSWSMSGYFHAWDDAGSDFGYARAVATHTVDDAIEFISHVKVSETNRCLHYTSMSLRYTSRSVRMVKPVGSPCAAVPQQPIIHSWSMSGYAAAMATFDFEDAHLTRTGDRGPPGTAPRQLHGPQVHRFRQRHAAQCAHGCQ
jgi:hypothetical protein